MLNLNLTDDRIQSNAVYEFYKDGLPALFLPDVKEINIIVGANNSRKSRFLRNVLSLEQKVLVESGVDLNVFYHLGLNLGARVLKLKENGISGSLVSMRIFAPENKLGQILIGFFEEVKEAHRNVTAENLSALIDDMSKLLLNMSHEQPVEEFTKKASQLETACGLILYLYQHVRESGNKLVSTMSYPDGPFRHMEPVIPGVEQQGMVPYVNETIDCIGDVEEWVRSIKGVQAKHHRKNNIYIPVLRTSRSLSGVSGDIFLETIKKQHFNDKLPSKVEVDTGLSLYEKINFARNGSTPERRAFTEFEHFIGITFFKSKDIHIVAHANRSNSEKTIRITVPGQREDVPIYDLGDGVQGVINLLFPVFTAHNGDWIFIDEPENHLHPGYQNIFMRAIAENEFLKKKGLRYFINTHSNHILSEAFLSPTDLAIFVFRNRDSNSSNIQSFSQNEYNTLELLGVMNTSVFVTNCTIWVEGITDRFYLRAFLNAYCKSLDEDQYRPNEGYDFSFIEYAGKNLVHYDFEDSNGDNIASYFLNSNVFLLADSDFDLEKHKKYEKINNPNFTYLKTQVPEIENLIPEKILKAFLIEDLHCDPKSVDSLPSLGANSKLGKTFSGITRKGKLIPIEAKHGGTLSPPYKSKLSKYVYTQILTDQLKWDDLVSSKRLKDIVVSLYKFIKKNNGKLSPINI
jgi:hypothetical protein